jgi:hypothetical protein
MHALQISHDERRLVAQYQKVAKVQSLTQSPLGSIPTKKRMPWTGGQTVAIEENDEYNSNLVPAHPANGNSLADPEPRSTLKKIGAGESKRGWATFGKLLGIVTQQYTDINQCYNDVQKNVRLSILLSVLGIVCGMICNELETNWWFLDPKKLMMGEYEIYYHRALLGDKLAGLILAVCLVVTNIRYHVLMLIREFSASAQKGQFYSLVRSTQHAPTIWDFSETRSRVIWQTIAILIVQIPWVDERMSVKGFPCGLSVHDPEGRYFYDTFLFLVLLAVRCCFVGRLVHVYQDLFSLEGDSMTALTQTKATFSLAMRTLLSRHQVRACIAIPLVYLMMIAYIHNKVEGSVVNVWPEDRTCDVSTTVCLQIWASEHPVTYFNSLWMHFVAASTIGFGEYTTHTHLGRLLLATSYYTALCMNSFIVFVVFDILPLSRMERMVTGRVHRRQINKLLRRDAAVLIQSLARSRQTMQQANALVNVPPWKSPKIVATLEPARPKESSDPEGRPSVEAPRHQSSLKSASNTVKVLRTRRLARTCEKKLNVALLRWRRARARVNDQLAECPGHDAEAAGAIMVIRANQIKADVDRALAKLADPKIGHVRYEEASSSSK